MSFEKGGRGSAHGISENGVSGGVNWSYSLQKQDGHIPFETLEGIVDKIQDELVESLRDEGCTIYNQGGFRNTIALRKIIYSRGSHNGFVVLIGSYLEKNAYLNIEISEHD